LSSRLSLAALMAAVLAGGVGGLALGKWAPKPPSSIEARRTMAWVFKAQADALMAEDRFAEAWGQLEVAVGLAPDDAHLRLAYGAAARERQNALLLQHASGALAGERLGEAAGELRHFGFPSIQEAKLEGVKAELQRQCEKAMDELEPRLATAETQLELSSALFRGGEVRIACAGPRVVKIDEMMRDAPLEAFACQKARRAFRGGAVVEATALAHQCAEVDRESLPLARSIDAFIKRRGRQDQMTSAELEGLIADADRIGWLAHSVPADEIRQRGVARFLKKAQQCRAAKDWRGVALYVGSVQYLDPDNAEALELRRESSRIVLRGTYNSNERDPGEASRLFERIMDMGTEDELAQTRLGKRP
jgi:hypothetical protein